MPSRFSSRCACPDYWQRAPRFPSAPSVRFPSLSLCAALFIIGAVAIASILNA